MRIARSLPVLALALAATAAAQGPAAASAAKRATTQALPIAEPPAAKLVPFSPPPPPPAVPTAQRLLGDEELLAASADVPDEPAVAEEIDKESEELEDLRRAEEASNVQDRAPTAPHASTPGRIALIPELDHDLATLQGEYDIPIDVNEAVVGYIRFFQSRAARKHFVKWLGRSHRYMERYRAILKEEGLPQDTVFLAMIESGFGNFAYSRAKASGPWQFIASTGKIFGLKQDFWVDERRDPEKAARAAARYLKKLYEQTGDWRLAWAGYNAGVGRVYKARAKGYDTFWEMAATKGRKILRPETKGYVPKLMAAAIITKHPEAFGFRAEEIERQSWDEYAEVEIPAATLLAVVAEAAGHTERGLMDLNPELRRACTPPRPYAVKIPKEKAEAFAAAWPELSAKTKMSFAGHVVRKGDTLASIGKAYGVPAEGIREMNGLRASKKLKVGQELIIPRTLNGGALAAARAPAARRSEPREPAARREGRRERARAAVTAAAAAPAAGASDRGPRSTLKVRAGDTLWSISRRLGVELDELCRWNGIENPKRHKLVVGAQLVVYGERG